MPRLDFSVLLSVYWKENPDWLRLSLKSIWEDQSLKPAEIVLVKDGPLTDRLETVISQFKQSAPLKIVPLSQNQGLGRALNEGLKFCSFDLVARMDTDDISKPDRFEKQIRFISQHPDISVVGSWVDEFIGNPDHVVSERKLPSTPDELYRFGQTRNPMNHPTVLFRKKKVLEVGGYEHFPLFEDYWLWCRMLQHGCKLGNIPQSLLWFRASPDVYKRRGGWRYAMTELKFQKELFRLVYIGLPRMILNVIIRFVVRIMPNYFRRILYNKLARK